MYSVDEYTNKLVTITMRSASILSGVLRKNESAKNCGFFKNIAEYPDYKKLDKESKENQTNEEDQKNQESRDPYR